MEIFNEIKPKEDAEVKKFVHRSLAEVQRAKLDKLMKNPVGQFFILNVSRMLLFILCFRKNRCLFPNLPRETKNTMLHLLLEMLWVHRQALDLVNFMFTVTCAGRNTPDKSTLRCNRRQKG